MIIMMRGEVEIEEIILIIDLEVDLGVVIIVVIGGVLMN